MPGYTTASSFCRSSMGKGGVCILCMNGFAFLSVDAGEFYTEGFCKPNSYWIFLEDAWCFLLSVYRRPHTSMDGNGILIDSMTNLLESISKLNQQIIAASYFNTDLSVYDSSSKKTNQNLYCLSDYMTRCFRILGNSKDQNPSLTTSFVISVHKFKIHRYIRDKKKSL